MSHINFWLACAERCEHATETFARMSRLGQWDGKAAAPALEIHRLPFDLGKRRHLRAERGFASDLTRRRELHRDGVRIDVAAKAFDDLIAHRDPAVGAMD